MLNDFTAEVITIYCLCDDFLCAWGHTDAPQARITTAEVMTVALVAASLLCGNQDLCRCLLKQHGYIKHMPSKGNLNRRLHQVSPQVWQSLLRLLAQVHEQVSGQPAAAACTRTGSTARRCTATLPANVATSMVCACTFW